MGGAMRMDEQVSYRGGELSAPEYRCGNEVTDLRVAAMERARKILLGVEY